MTALNSILAKIYSPLGLAAGRDLSGEPRPALQDRQAPGEGDVFRAGQHWRNRAAGDNSGLAASGCRCGSCSVCAAQAYTVQAKSMSADSEVGENKGEQGAAGKIGSSREAEAEEKEQGTDEAGGESDTPRTRVKGNDGEPLGSEEVARLLELKKADAAVRAHEQAHLAAAGGLAKGGASFAYQRGPDGRNYAVAGEVQIDTSEGATPEETVAKMARVRAAALAPANPSPQDRKVAQSASVAMSEARLEINVDKRAVEEQVEEAGENVADEKTEGETVKDEAEQGLGKQQSRVTARVASLYLARAGGQGIFHQSA